jgi:hypothetical protein
MILVKIDHHCLRVGRYRGNRNLVHDDELVDLNFGDVESSLNGPPRLRIGKTAME